MPEFLTNELEDTGDADNNANSNEKDNTTSDDNGEKDNDKSAGNTDKDVKKDDGGEKKGVPTNYEDLYKTGTDKALNSFIDRQITRATETAVTNALEKQRIINDKQLSEAEKLKNATDAEKAAYYKSQMENMQKMFEAKESQGRLKTETEKQMRDNYIPIELMPVSFDFENDYNITADDIKNKIDILAGFEYYPKGTFEKAVTAAVNEKLKQVTPENRGNPDKKKTSGVFDNNDTYFM